MPYGIMIVEDEETLAKNIKRYLEKNDYEVRVAGDYKDAVKEFVAFSPDLVLLDYQLPGRSGIEVLKAIREHDRQVKVIMMTAHGSIEIAVEAMKAGAYDYLNKPLILSELKVLIDKALGQERLEGALSYFHERQAAQGTLEGILGSSTAIETLRQKVRQILKAESSLSDQLPPAVLITGETGTGKELVARALHFDGPRRDEPFVELNCAAIPEQLIEAELFGYERGAFTDAKGRKMGLAEAAHGGTLFLDEIGELALPVQAKLLKLLEDRTIRRLGSVRDRQVNLRIVAATNRTLEQLVNRGDFRSDLYFRLRTITLTLPPLRDRQDDILFLARHFLELHGRRYRRDGLCFAKDAERALLRHDWPGNVRELRNIMEQAVLLSTDNTIEAAQLALAPGLSLDGGGAALDLSSRLLPESGLNLEDLERALVEQALERTNWNVTRAAKLLGLTRDTLRYRIDKYGLRSS